MGSIQNLTERTSRLPGVGVSIFSRMSALAVQTGAVNLSQGFPDFACSPDLVEQVSQAMRNGHNQYVPMQGLPALREQIARKLLKTQGVTLNSETDITITAGATQAIFTAVLSCVLPGDEVVVIEPAYDCYLPAIIAAGGVPVIHELSAPDFSIDWDSFSKKITPKTRLVILNNPNNPACSILTSEDLDYLEQLTDRFGFLILSDEVYEHLTFDSFSHVSIASRPALRDRSMVVFSFGKTFHVTGWKTGYIIGPELLMREFRKLHQFNVFCVNSAMQFGLAEYMKTDISYSSISEFFQTKRDFFLERIKGLPLRPLPSKGTYFMLLSYCDISDLNDIDFAEHLTIKAGVASVPLSAFYQSQQDQRLLRFCFAKKEETLEQAAEKLRSYFR